MRFVSNAVLALVFFPDNLQMLDAVSAHRSFHFAMTLSIAIIFHIRHMINTAHTDINPFNKMNTILFLSGGLICLLLIHFFL